MLRHAANSAKRQVTQSFEGSGSGVTGLRPGLELWGLERCNTFRFAQRDTVEEKQQRRTAPAGNEIDARPAPRPDFRSAGSRARV